MKLAAALTAVVLAAVPSAVQAQPRASYVATAAAAPEKTTLLTRATAWNCAGATCTATRASGSHQTMCQLLVREIGPLTAFQARGTSFDAGQLEKCNAAAR